MSAKQLIAALFIFLIGFVAIREVAVDRQMRNENSAEASREFADEASDALKRMDALDQQIGDGRKCVSIAGKMSCTTPINAE